MLTKQQREPYIWDDKIKIKTKDGKFDYEEETKEKVKKLERNYRTRKYNNGTTNRH